MKQLRGVAADLGLTLNDMLAADLFLTIADWNSRLRKRTSRRCFRVMIPFDLREPEDYATPATNLAAYTFLKRLPRELLDEQHLLASIRDDTARIKHYRLGTVFADVNYSLERVPAIRRWLLDLNLCTATAVLSNVGDPARRFTARFPRQKGSVVCGNLVLEGISGAPPIRRHTRVAISLFSYRRELTVSVRTDPFLYTDNENREFLMAYVQQIARRLPARPRCLDSPLPRAIASARPAELQPPTESFASTTATAPPYAVVNNGNGRHPHHHGFSPVT
jgi:hypothetical protein